jgi:ABC-type polysaccharide/polyol phosphate export permease
MLRHRENWVGTRVDKPLTGSDIPVYDSGRIKVHALFELRELFRYRFLISNLISRDLKVRYKRSVLGFVWVMLNPLLTMSVIAIVFTNVFKFGGIHYYPTYLLSGILIWNIFAQGSVAAMSNLNGNGSIMRRMYVPPSVFVASSIGSALVNFIFAIVPFFIIALINGVPISPMWALIIFPIFELTLFTMGIGLIVSAMMVFFNDIYEIYAVILSAFIYFTPIFYQLSAFENSPTWYAPILLRVESFNPMNLFVTFFRDPVLYHQIPGLRDLAVGAAFAVGVFMIGWFFFTRVEDKFVYNF